MSKICVASHHTTAKSLMADAEFQSIQSDPDLLIELRLDQYADLSEAAFQKLLNHFSPRKLLVTYRTIEEGGNNNLVTDHQRLIYLLKAIRAGVSYIDIELRTLQRDEKLKQELLAARDNQNDTLLIVSHHDFQCVPNLKRLQAIRNELEASGADIAKLAVKPSLLMDSLPLARLLSEDEKAWNKPFLGLAMGEEGFWSRVLGPIFPHAAPFTFAKGMNAPGTAPGQPTWQLLKEQYRFTAINPKWPVFGVLGNPIAHSRSPQMHNKALTEKQIDGVYLPFKLDGDPSAFVKSFAPFINLRGLSVTIPHKENILPACQKVAPVAQQIGAVNTLFNKNSATDLAPHWFGTNTDAEAASGSLEEAMGGPGSLTDKVVVILGAGGAARALAFGVKARGATVWIHNRTLARAQKLADEVGAQCVPKVDIVNKHQEIAAIVNTTPLGMHPNVDQSPLKEKEIPKGSVVFDTVYNPLHTKLLKLASARGCKILTGLAMFVGQGAVQFELFTGQAAPVEVMCEAVE